MFQGRTEIRFGSHGVPRVVHLDTTTPQLRMDSRLRGTGGNAAIIVKSPIVLLHRERGVAGKYKGGCVVGFATQDPLDGLQRLVVITSDEFKVSTVHQGRRVRAGKPIRSNDNRQ